MNGAPRLHPYKLVDVFAERIFEGNPLAVFPNAAGMSLELMQKIAGELNLSETVFVTPATRDDCTAIVRIFTPRREMAFAGHPTIGAAFVLLAGAIVPCKPDGFWLEEKIGAVKVSVDSGDPPLIWLTTPAVKEGRTFDAKVCAKALALEPRELLGPTPQMLDAGNPTIFVPLATKEAVDKCWLDKAGIRAIRGDGEPLCVFAFTPTQDGAYARMFAPEHGIPEDPATGSSAGLLLVYMKRRLGRGDPAKDLLIEQGTNMGRRSILRVREAGGQHSRIEVGGHVRAVGEGAFWL